MNRTIPVVAILALLVFTLGAGFAYRGNAGASAAPMDVTTYHEIIAALYIADGPIALEYSDEHVSAIDPGVRCGRVRRGGPDLYGASSARRFVATPRSLMIDDVNQAALEGAWQRYCAAPQAGKK